MAQPSRGPDPFRGHSQTPMYTATPGQHPQIVAAPAPGRMPTPVHSGYSGPFQSDYNSQVSYNVGALPARVSSYSGGYSHTTTGEPSHASLTRINEVSRPILAPSGYSSSRYEVRDFASSAATPGSRPSNMGNLFFSVDQPGPVSSQSSVQVAVTVTPTSTSTRVANVGMMPQASSSYPTHPNATGSHSRAQPRQ